MRVGNDSRRRTRQGTTAPVTDGAVTVGPSPTNATTSDEQTR